jgi:hypothetical protein
MYVMKKNRRLSRLFALFILFLLASVAPAYAAQVAVTVEKLAEDGGFIVEPSLVTLPGNSPTAANVIKQLLISRGIQFQYTGQEGSEFYMTTIAGLGYTTENPSGGWMITVNNRYIGTSAGLHTLYDGDVMRWQYTKQLGADIGGNPDNLGESGKPDKDELIWKVAEINAAGNQSDYGSAYTAALSVLKNLSASSSAINSAFATLDGTEEEETSISDTGENGGGGCNAGASMGALIILGLALLPRRNLRTRAGFLSRIK